MANRIDLYGFRKLPLFILSKHLVELSHSWCETVLVQSQLITSILNLQSIENLDWLFFTEVSDATSPSTSALLPRKKSGINTDHGSVRNNLQLF